MSSLLPMVLFSLFLIVFINPGKSFNMMSMTAGKNIGRNRQRRNPTKEKKAQSEMSKGEERILDLQMRTNMRREIDDGLFQETPEGNEHGERRKAITVSVY